MCISTGYVSGSWTSSSAGRRRQSCQQLSGTTASEHVLARRQWRLCCCVLLISYIAAATASSPAPLAAGRMSSAQLLDAVVANANAVADAAPFQVANPDEPGALAPATDTDPIPGARSYPAHA